MGKVGGKVACVGNVSHAIHLVGNTEASHFVQPVPLFEQPEPVCRYKVAAPYL